MGAKRVNGQNRVNGPRITEQDRQALKALAERKEMMIGPASDLDYIVTLPLRARRMILKAQAEALAATEAERERCIHAFLNWCGKHPSPTINMAPHLIDRGIREALGE